MEFKLIIDPEAEESVVVTAKKPGPITRRLEAVVTEYGSGGTLMAYHEEDRKLLKFSDIACISIIDGKTCAIDRRGKQYRLKQRLYEVEQLVPGSFFRINKSALANENHLDRFQASFSGAVDAVFTCGYREYVSRRCFTEIKRRYEK